MPFVTDDEGTEHWQFTQPDDCDRLGRMHHNTTRVGTVRACPDCGQPQHYTGTEHGWAHDALLAMWDCAGERVRANQTTETGP